MRPTALKSVFAGAILVSLVYSNVLPLDPASAQTGESEKIVVAHRGASGYLPEHTLPGVSMAYAMGADFLEQDVVMTRDDRLIVWHDLTLNRTTDVDDRFPDRAREDGLHYVIDFTLEELRTLRVTSGRNRMEDGGERTPEYPGRFPLWQSRFRIHTFSEQLELVRGLNQSTGRDVGIYPEVKSPAFHHEHGKDLASAVIRTLRDFGYTTPDSNVYVQTFDHDELKRLHYDIMPLLNVDLKLVQLMGGGMEYRWMLNEEGMREVARFADGVGPHYSMIITDGSTRNNLMITELVPHAHQAGLAVHPYTFRGDPGLVPDYAEDFEHMLELFYFEARVDGVFTDFPDRAVNFLRNH